MQAREIKAEVEITKQECEVKTICNVCGLREVSKLDSKIRQQIPDLRIPSAGHPVEENRLRLIRSTRYYLS